MEREYDIFEQLADGTPMWRGHAMGLLSVRRQMEQIAAQTKNECFAIHLPTKGIVARVNIGRRAPVLSKRMVFQIAYDPKLAPARIEALRLHGYEVASVFGNEAAKLVLALPQTFDVFLIGHAAPEEERKEMVAWLKSHYPGVRVVALNSPAIKELNGADYNVPLNGPDTWLPFVSAAPGNPFHNAPSF